MLTFDDGKNELRFTEPPHTKDIDKADKHTEHCSVTCLVACLRDIMSEGGNTALG